MRPARATSKKKPNAKDIAIGMLEREKKIVRGQHVGFTVWICFCFLVYNDLRLPLFPKLSSATISRSDPWCLPGSSLVAAVIDNRRRTNEVFICEGRFHSPRPIPPPFSTPASARRPTRSLPSCTSSPASAAAPSLPTTSLFWVLSPGLGLPFLAATAGRVHRSSTRGRFVSDKHPTGYACLTGGERGFSPGW
jgi:hypothetical protein